MSASARPFTTEQLALAEGMRRAGATYEAIANALTDAGHLAPTGLRRWRVGDVVLMLREGENYEASELVYRRPDQGRGAVEVRPPPLRKRAAALPAIARRR